MPNPPTADIRQFLIEAFSDDELATLCFDFFPQVSDDFAAGMTKGQKIQRLIEYCHRHEVIPNLLAALERARPKQFKAHFPSSPHVDVSSEPAALVRDPRQVFISHAHQDAEFAHRLADDLRERGWRVWIAPGSIRPGEKWVDAINGGLEGSGVFVLVLTPAALRSRWVRDETNATIELEHEGHVRFVPVGVELCDVPPLWRTYQRIAFQGDYARGLTNLIYALDPQQGERECRAREEAARQEQERLQTELVAREAAEPQAREKAEAEREEQERKIEKRVTAQPPPGWARPALPKWALPAAGSVLAVIVLAVMVWLAGTRITENAASRQTSVPLQSATPFPIVTRVAEKDGMVMMYVPAGEFLMGSTDADIGAILASCSDCKRESYAIEQPQHKVYLDAFWIDRTEVTNAMYAHFVSEMSYKTDAEKDGKDADWQHPGGPSTNIRGLDNHPIVQVSWNDAQAYCQWAGRRLPTEAQWEKAARGTDGRIYPWGNQRATCEYAVMYDDNKNGCGEGDAPSAVGSRPKGASPYGAMDMAGNVWEWVNDWYQSDYYGGSPSGNPPGPTSGISKVLRGGSFRYHWDGVRVASRGNIAPGIQNFNIGIRCAGVAPGQ